VVRILTAEIVAGMFARALKQYQLPGKLCPENDAWPFCPAGLVQYVELVDWRSEFAPQTVYQCQIDLALRGDMLSLRNALGRFVAHRKESRFMGVTSSMVFDLQRVSTMDQCVFQELFTCKLGGALASVGDCLEAARDQFRAADGWWRLLKITHAREDGRLVPI